MKLSFLLKCLRNVTFEGQPPGQDLPEDDAPAEHVALLGVRAALQINFHINSCGSAALFWIRTRLVADMG